ncbi:hypothetical protein H072_2897 [Dactylellina haptotyla CBS 200.50]|uniref:F-box domain-containing protein n=1 Tax=Dactylellina haptotyla (strain CBS 200.50) TaxID=1284197 RepID=S8BUG9_DACHA|nr:hypothetical protein H072_2897 [Dactylellina haptotyla CBS 200.50]
MTGITDLPTEILLQIFGSGLLTLEDSAHLKRVCWRLRNVTQQCKGFTYNFVVDEPKQKSWMLVRYLILNPSLGEQISSIKMTWRRRDGSDRATWTRPWHWTKTEKAAIWELNKIYSFSQGMAYAAAMGVNSEAILPILLCYTPNLISLDLGDTVPDLLLKDYMERPNGKNMNELLVELLHHRTNYHLYDEFIPNENDSDLEEMESDPTEYLSGNATAQRLMFNHIPGSGYIWLHMNINDRIPGLASLKYFENGIRRNEGIPGIGDGLGGPVDFHHVRVSSIWPTFFLPRIESIKVAGLSNIDTQADDWGRFTPLYTYYEKRKSPVKRLYLMEASLWPAPVISLAKLTKNLEYFEWEETTLNGFYTSENPEWEQLREIASILISNNEATLDRNNVRLAGYTIEDLEVSAS